MDSRFSTVVLSPAARPWQTARAWWQRHARHLASWMVLSLLAFVPLAAGVLWLAASERVLVGVELGWSQESQAVCLHPGADCKRPVVSIRSPYGALELDAWLLSDAGHFLPSHELREAYNDRHKALHALLASDSARLVMADGSERPVTVRDRGLGGIGPMLWWHLLLAALAWTSGWAHFLRQRSLAHGFLALACSGYAIGMALGGLELVHGLAWPLGAAGSINGAARAAVQLAFAGYLGYVLTLPRRYVPARWLGVLPCLALAVIVVDLAALAPAPMWGHQAFMVVWTLALPLAMGWQWRRSHSPLLRALMQWFALGGLILLARLALIHALPVQDLETRAFFVSASFLAVKTYSIVVLLVSPVLGWAQGGLRRILLWVLASLLLVVCDLMLVLALSVQAETALLISLLVVGAAYLPLRGWIAQTLLGIRPLRLEQHIAPLYDVARAAQQSDMAALQAWQQFLRQVYEPESSVLAQQAGPHSRLQDAGGALWAPLAWTGQGVVLVHAHGGRHLFGPQDERFADHCAHLVQTMVEKDRAAMQARQSERERIAHDLHDDLGARLLHMAHAAPPGDWGRYAQDTLQEMRLITHGMAGEAVALTDLLADLRAELAARIRAAGLQLQWQSALPGQAGSHRVRPQAALALARILSEAVRNAISHGGASRIEVLVQVLEESLLVQVRNDGPATDPATWGAGLGMQSLLRRVQRLGGHLQWQALGSGGTVMEARLPLNALQEPG